LNTQIDPTINGKMPWVEAPCDNIFNPAYVGRSSINTNETKHIIQKRTECINTQKEINMICSNPG
jgi:hypothetical protein